MSERDRKLGINRPICRRDFISGVGVALSGSLVSCSWAERNTPLDPEVFNRAVQDSQVSYPPVRTGMRGSHPGSFEIAHQLREGKRWGGAEVEDSGEHYDLVVVGGGLSGLSAAWFFREAEPEARILILDNHDDFGGHAKRNEFWHGDRMLLSNGGTVNIEDFNDYGEPAQRLIRSLGIDPGRYSEFADRDLYRSFGMHNGVFFASEAFGSDSMVVGSGERGWREFLARTPLSKTAQKDIARLYESDIDYMDGLSPEQKRDRLRNMSYQEFLVEFAGIGPEALLFLQNDGYWAIGIDALTAWAMVRGGAPGTAGLGFENKPEERIYFRFPDGNASVARMLVRSLIPGVAPGTTMEDVVAARFDYNRLDDPGSSARIRLESTVVDVRHLGDPQEAQNVQITYVRDGRARKVHADRTVLACYNSMIPYICEELPEAQKQALSLSLKAPLIYVNVLIRNWKAFANLGVSRVDCKGSYFRSIRLSPPINIGDYHHASSPEDPIILSLSRNPLSPGLSAQEQWKAGRYELLSTTFETFERNIRSQLDRVLSPGGFDAARDIEAITVNRWPHGYAYGQDAETGEIAYLPDEVPPEKAPWIAARQPYGRIAIANSDAAANAMTEGAIGQAYWAVMELVSA